MKIFLFLILTVLVFSGCQTISGSGNPSPSQIADISAIKGSKSHVIDVEVDQNLNSMLNKVYFYNITEGENQYILVSGSIKKQMGGSSIDRKKINARFLNDTDEVISEGTDKVAVSNMRRPRRSKGKFSIKVPYSPDIKKCLLAFEV